MITQIMIRRAKLDEGTVVRELVQTVVDEIYGVVCDPAPVPIDQDWTLAWVAVSDGKIVGMVLTQDEWIGDLWVLPESRGLGIGQKLLAQGEAEIIGRGHRTLRLRVAKSNKKAVHFYQRQGWQIAREFPHEKLSFAMLEMNKSTRPG